MRPTDPGWRSTGATPCALASSAHQKRPLLPLSCVYEGVASLDAEAFHGLAGELGDQVEVLVQVQHGALVSSAAAAISRSGIDGARCWPRSASRRWTSTARSSTAGVRYSTGIAATGGYPAPGVSSTADRAEKPASSRVTC